jgi:hypothetical protein
LVFSLRWRANSGAQTAFIHFSTFLDLRPVAAANDLQTSINGRLETRISKSKTPVRAALIRIKRTARRCLFSVFVGVLSSLGFCLRWFSLFVGELIRIKRTARRCLFSVFVGFLSSLGFSISKKKWFRTARVERAHAWNARHAPNVIVQNMLR